MHVSSYLETVASFEKCLVYDKKDKALIGNDKNKRVYAQDDYTNQHRKGWVYYRAPQGYEDRELVCRSVYVDIESDDGSIDQRVEVYNAMNGYEVDYEKGALLALGLRRSTDLDAYDLPSATRRRLGAYLGLVWHASLWMCPSCGSEVLASPWRSPRGEGTATCPRCGCEVQLRLDLKRGLRGILA